MLKLFEGLVLFAVGIGVVRLVHRDMVFDVERWADLFRADPNNRYIHRVLEKISGLNARKLREFSVGTFLYSAIRLTEGTGLLLGKSWAKYFTIIVTACFIPLEVYELVRRASWAKSLVLALNIAVVAYLVVEVRRNRTSR